MTDGKSQTTDHLSPNMERFLYGSDDKLHKDGDALKNVRRTPDTAWAASYCQRCAMLFTFQMRDREPVPSFCKRCQPSLEHKDAE